MAYGFTYTLPTITGSHTDFPVLLREDDFPSAAIDGGSSSILNGGGNLRAYTSSAKTTRLPVDVVSFVSGATPAAEVWVKIPTAATGNTIYIEADDTETTQPAVTNTYGRNAVWSDYRFVIHGGSVVDSSGNLSDGTLGGGLSSTAPGPFGWGSFYDFDGTDDSITFEPVSTLNAIQAIVELDSSPSDDESIVANMDGSNNGFLLIADNSDFSSSHSNTFVGSLNSTSGRKTSGANTAVPGTGHALFYSKGLGMHFDGSLTGPYSTTTLDQSNADLVIGGSPGYTSTPINGRIGEVRMRTTDAPSTDWISTEYANQSASGAWGTVGTWADSGGGVSASIGLVTETSTAFSLAAAKSMSVGLAGETDSALSLTAGHVVTTGQAASTESAFSLSWSKLMDLGLAVETDSALSMSYSASTVVQIGISSEADSAFQMGRVKTLAIGQSDETDTALSVAAQKSLSIGLSSESDSALAVSIAKALSLDIAVEADAALAFAYPQTIAIGVSQETDQALSFSVSLAGGVIAAARATRHTYTSRPAAISRSRRH